MSFESTQERLEKLEKNILLLNSKLDLFVKVFTGKDAVLPKILNDQKDVNIQMVKSDYNALNIAGLTIQLIASLIINENNRVEISPILDGITSKIEATKIAIQKAEDSMKQSPLPPLLPPLPGV